MTLAQLQAAAEQILVWLGWYQKKKTNPDLPEPPLPIIPMPKYDWSTVNAARHSVRVICDEEGLTLEQKNTLCATVGAESGWQSYFLEDGVGHKAGDPVIHRNISETTGHLTSTDWGIAQINDRFHVGPGLDFSSSKYVLDNPERCIRWMCKQWKLDHRDWWIAYKNNSYKKYLGLR